MPETNPALLARDFFAVARPSAPSDAVQSLLKRQKDERRAIVDGADKLRALRAADQQSLAALTDDERAAADKLGELSLSLGLGEKLDTKTVAAARRELDALRERRAEIEGRIAAAERRIAEAERDCARRLAELCERQAKELQEAWHSLIAANNRRWPELAKEIDERVASEIALRTAATAAQTRARHAEDSASASEIAREKASILV